MDFGTILLYYGTVQESSTCAGSIDTKTVIDLKMISRTHPTFPSTAQYSTVQYSIDVKHNIKLRSSGIAVTALPALQYGNLLRYLRDYYEYVRRYVETLCSKKIKSLFIRT